MLILYHKATKGTVNTLFKSTINNIAFFIILPWQNNVIEWNYERKNKIKMSS
jgi:hypothetical protein